MKEEKKQTKSSSGKKRSFSLTTLIITAIVAILLGGISVFVVMNSRLQAAEQTSESMGKINTVYKALDKYYYKNISKKKLENGALNGMVDVLNDQFSEYMTKSETQSLNETISSSFTGIGAEVRKTGEQIQIVSPISGTPAQKGGLKAKDIILKIDGKSLNGYSLNKAVSLIRGKKGSSVKLLIKRGSTTFEKTFKRDTIPVKTVNGKLDDDNKKVGYIQVTTFSEKTAQEMKKTIKQLRKKGAKSFVIDMRNNPGGLMDQALKLSSMFLKDGKTIMQVQQRDGKKEVYKAGKKYDDGFKVHEKTVVMINGGSASAAEIFAAALKQSANDQLVGTKSFGKGTVQNAMPFNDKTELKLTVAKWLTPDGSWIHEKGIKPSIKADYPSVAYQAAIDNKKSYQEDDVSKNVKSLQIFLKALGYKPGRTDGYYDSGTKNAVKKFQQTKHLSANGIADKKTIDSIQESVAQFIIDSEKSYDTAIKAAN